MATIPKDSAQFVFRGTVQQTKAANLSAITDTKRTVVATVEEVVRGPEALRGFAGQEITVELAKGERVKEGQEAIFYTNGWLFGESLAVQSLGHEAVTGTAARVAADAAVDPAREARQQQIRERAVAADLVVSGKVVAVGVPDKPAALAGGPDAPPTGPISEHEPFWSEAVVEVDQVHRGEGNPQRIVIRFPASTDVRWHRAPKFQAGQEGVFLLQPDQISGLQTLGAAAAALAPAGSYTCLQAVDFQPAHHEEDVETAIAAAEA